MDWATLALGSLARVPSTLDSRNILKQVNALKNHADEVEDFTLPSFAAALAFVNTKMIKYLADEPLPRGFNKELLFNNLNNPVLKEKISIEDINLDKVKEFLDILEKSSESDGPAYRKFQFGGGN